MALLSNSFSLAIVKLLITSYAIPPTAAWLARMKYGVKSHNAHLGSSLTVQIFRTQVRSALSYSNGNKWIEQLLAAQHQFTI